jgi:hypothetical protein
MQVSRISGDKEDGEMTAAPEYDPQLLLFFQPGRVFVAQARSNIDVGTCSITGLAIWQLTRDSCHMHCDGAGLFSVANSARAEDTMEM